MHERMSSLLPKDTNQVSLSILPRREPFEILYRLNCDNLCADFQEDLEFRFSWGITSLIQRFCGKNANRICLLNFKEKPGDLPTPTESADSSLMFPASKSTDWSIPSKIALASIGSQGTMGGMLVAGFMMKTIGWRVIAVTGAIYGLLYLYERLTWTNKAKERVFKEQYVAHATKKLRLIVDLTSANCSHQVQQELSSTFAQLCHLVDGSTSEMDARLKELEKEIKALEKAANEAKVLRNKANYLSKELEMFDDTYLRIKD